MKKLLLILLFLPGLVFAREIPCSSIGGTCKNYCTGNELEVKGSFIDCERQVCCISEEEPGGAGKPSEKTGKEKPAVKLPEATAPKVDLPPTAGATGPAKAGQVIVCNSTTDAQPDKDTPLICGNTITTLRKLSEQNYRLIQTILILSGEK